MRADKSGCRWLACAALIPAIGTVHAQTMQAPTTTIDIEEFVVTGSRIRRTEVDTPAPITVVDQSVLSERGFVQIGQALNEVTSMTPSIPIRPTNTGDNSSGGGEQLPALFGLGSGRTLTLVNGRRFVSTASSFGVPGALQGNTNDSVVDTNLIPTALLKRVEIVQGSGAAVYGSDAIGGVVNYLLRDDFDGIEIDGRYGETSRGDYPTSNLRAAWGTNFLQGRGNVAVSAEWSKTDPLLTRDRRLPAVTRTTIANSADTGPNDGIASVVEVLDSRFWEFSNTGVLFAPPNPASFPVRSFITTNGIPFNQFAPGGIPAQFDAAGTNLVAFNPGTFLGPGPSIPFASGGGGVSYGDLGALYSGVERANVNLIGHYDLTSKMRLSTELLYANVEGTDPRATLVSNTILNSAASGSGPISVLAANPYLSDAARTSIVSYLNANPTLFGPNSGFGWAAGAPIPVTLSKAFPDLLPDTNGTREVDTSRAVLALDGDFSFAQRNLYWSVGATYGRSEGSVRNWDIWASRFNNAIDARASGGNIVCGINADADPTNDDPACAPINPFGVGNISQAATNYVSALFGQDFENTQYDYLASVSGGVLSMPAGDLSFSFALEHREESADFTPTDATRLGVGRAATPVPAQSGGYNTNEASLELLVPIFGGDYRMPGLHTLDVTGAYRYVDNSLAGSEDVWSTGLRWRPIEDVMLRVARSRNFRAPNLAQLLAPTTTGLEAIGIDPCDADRVNAGPNPAVRLANCQALFAANPGYGPLATFQDPAENFPSATIARGGNPNLKNEISDTLSYGIVLQPRMVEGLAIIVDRVEIDLENGLSFFAPQDFLSTCFDSPVQPQNICAVTTRDAQGFVVASSATTFNAGSIRYRGEVYDVNYAFPLSKDRNFGLLDLTVQATHTSLLETSVTGVDLTRTQGTAAQPDWRGRFNARYERGPLGVAYTLNYLPEVLVAVGATVENNANPVVDANYVHNISARYDVTDYLTVSGGVENFTDEEPSYPTIFYGDILGRQYYMAAKVKF